MAIDKHVICGCFHVNMVIEFKQYKKRKEDLFRESYYIIMEKTLRNYK